MSNVVVAYRSGSKFFVDPTVKWNNEKGGQSSQAVSFPDQYLDDCVNRDQAHAQFVIDHFAKKNFEVVTFDMVEVPLKQNYATEFTFTLRSVDSVDPVTVISYRSGSDFFVDRTVEWNGVKGPNSSSAVKFPEDGGDGVLSKPVAQFKFVIEHFSKKDYEHFATGAVMRYSDNSNYLDRIVLVRKVSYED